MPHECAVAEPGRRDQGAEALEYKAAARRCQS